MQSRIIFPCSLARWKASSPHGRQATGSLAKRFRKGEVSPDRKFAAALVDGDGAASAIASLEEKQSKTRKPMERKRGEDMEAHSKSGFPDPQMVIWLKNAPFPPKSPAPGRISLCVLGGARLNRRPPRSGPPRFPLSGFLFYHHPEALFL